MAEQKRKRKTALPKPKAKLTGASVGASHSPSPRGSGSRMRVTTDMPGISLMPGYSYIEPPPSAETDWQIAELDSLTLYRATPERLMELLIDLSPDDNRAQFDWSRELNPGWSYTVMVPGTETQHEQGYQLVEAFCDRLKMLYGSVDIPINRMFMGVFMRGASFCELVLGRDKHIAIDLATPDPSIVRFRRVEDPQRGLIFEPGVLSRGGISVDDGWVSYALPTIKYLPLDPMPGKPYGRPMISAALYTSIFLLGMLHDLRRVIAQQGYPRPDIEVVWEQLRTQMPSEMDQDSEEAAQWIAAIVQQVATAYAQLQPEDAYVHTDVVKLNRPVGTLDASSLGSLGSLIEALERMMVRALKTAPFMMAVADGTTETQANRQWEAHLQGVKSVQHLVESALEGILEYYLMVNGILADVEWRFAVNRKGDELRDAMAEQQRIANEREKLAAGWTEQDEASMAITEHDASEPEPRDGAWLTAVDIAEATKPAEPEQEPEPVASEEPTNDQQDGDEDTGRAVQVTRIMHAMGEWLPDSLNIRAEIENDILAELTGAGKNGAEHG